MALTNVLIATQTTTAAVSTVTFSNIPQTYTDLMIRYTARGTASSYADFLYMKPNGVSSGDHIAKYLWADGTTLSAFEDRTHAIFGPVPGANATTNLFSNLRFHIPQYTSSNHKTLKVSGGTPNAAATEYRVYHGMAIHPGTSAITSITIDSYTGNNIAANSTFNLYGITRA